MKTTVLFLLGSVGLWCASGVGVAGTVTMKIDPRATYLRQDPEDSPQFRAPAISLAAAGIQPGEVLRFRAIGAWSPDPSSEESPDTLAVFSADDTLLSSDNQNRVPGAISCGRNTETIPTLFNGFPTDIPEDFGFGLEFNDILVTVPAGANFLFVAAADVAYVDNSDPNNDYFVEIEDIIPIITSPLSLSAVRNQPFVYQFQTIAADSLSVGSLPPGLIFDPSLSAIVGTPSAEGTFQVGLSASNANGTTDATLTITVQPVPSGPLITSSTSATGRTGSPFKFQVITSGGSAATRLDATNVPAGLTFDPVTGLLSGTPTSDGSSAISLTVTDGSFSAAATLQLTFISDPALPVIVSPSEAAVAPGETFSYKISAPAAEESIEFALVGNLPQGLGFDSSSGTISGTYTGNVAHLSRRGRVKPLSGGVITNVQLFATNSRGTTTLPLVFFLKPAGVVNISTRLAVQTGENVLIGGFIITGNAPKRLLIRAIGPSLEVGGRLQDPVMELYDSNGLLGSNDDWRSNQEQEIVDTTIPPSNSLESAILATLNPGAYTAIVKGKADETGVGLVELYDLGTASLDSSSQSKFANISTRGFVQRGDDVLIGGFIITSASTRLIVRAIGPSLGTQGVAGALDDTTLEVRDGGGELVALNDDWRSNQEQEITETTVPPNDNRESAVVGTFNAGNYTAIVRGANDTTGIGLVEVYSLN